MQKYAFDLTENLKSSDCTTMISILYRMTISKETIAIATTLNCCSRFATSLYTSMVIIELCRADDYALSSKMSPKRLVFNLRSRPNQRRESINRVGCYLV